VTGVKQPQSAVARAPRGIVQIALSLGGQLVPVPFVDLEVNNNTFYAADTFRVHLPVSGLPATLTLEMLLATQPDIYVECWAGFPSDPTSYTTGGLSRLIYGKADEVTWDMATNAMEISGRDLSSIFIDNKTEQKYPNLTSSQIVAKLAATAGLKANVVATGTKVGKYYDVDHVRLQDDRTQWDLLTYLAREEQYVVYVEGTTLNFIPQPKDSQTPYQFTYSPAPTLGGSIGLNAENIKITHQKTLAKGVTVTVRSWNQNQSKTFTKKATASHVNSGLGKGGSGGSIKGSPQNYSYTIANLTPDQAQQKANSLLAEISRHEIKAEIEGPADNALSRTDVIQITGTGTVVDTQVFHIASIVRTLSMADGYKWKVEAKNHSPESTVTA